MRTVVDILRRQAQERPDAPAFIFLTDGETESARAGFAELDAQARGIGAALSAACRPQERALLLYPTGLEFVGAFLGCLYGGMIAVPAYPPRSQRGLPRLRAIIQDARPSVVLTTADLLERARGLLDGVPELLGARWLATDDLEARPGDWREPDLDSDTIAFLQYTSGSTSTPKGVMVSHANLVHNEEMIRRAFAQSESSVIVGWLPLYHDMGLIGNVLQPLYLGAQCVLMSPVSFLQQPARWLQAVSRYRGTTSGGPNFAYELSARKVTEEQKAGLDLSCWNLAFNGAEPVRADTLTGFMEAFGGCGFRREAFYPCYGLAEATLFAAGGTPGAPPKVRSFQPAALEQGYAEEAVDGGRRLVGCGRAWLGQRVEVVDPETARLCPPGRVGEVWISGPSVAKGYWGRPEATERDFHARLADDPEAGPFLRTGDLGLIQYGELFVTGRLKDLIILRGRNHYPQDIELTAERAHPALRPGGGAAFSVEAGGEERLVIVQELERRAGDDPPDTVADGVREAVAREHEVQVYEVVLIRTGTILKTSSGKIQRHACRNAYLADAFAVVARSAVARDEAPTPSAEDWGAAEPSLEALATLTPEERAAALLPFLRSLAARVLRVPATKLEPDRPLSALGLDSLSAVELQQQVQARLGAALSLGGMLEGASLRHLAEEALGQLDAGGPPPAVISNISAAPLAAGTDLPLSAGQKALWFLQRLEPESAAWNIAATARISGQVDAAALGRAFQSLADRHPVLRTTFHDRSGLPVARAHERLDPGFSVEDAPGLDGEILSARLRATAFRPFDLQAGPLLRVTLLRLSRDEHALALAVHHLVADFASLAVLVNELGRLYVREIGGEAPPLAPLPVTWFDYVRWQESRLAGPEGERLWAWWRETLAGPLPDLDLSADHPRPAVRTDRGVSVGLAFGAELTAHLHGLARASGATLYAVLLAGFQAVLHRWSGQSSFAVGSPMAGREMPELAGVLGYFVNPVVLRADASGDLSFQDFLERTRRVAVGALEHQGFPFALLAERLRPVRDPGRTPLFQALFTLQGGPGPEHRALAPFALDREGAEVRVGPLTLSTLPLRERPAQLDLSLDLAEGEDGLAASLLVSADLFEEGTAVRLLEHLRVLLVGAVERPELRLSELPLLTAAERRQVLVDWNDTAADYPADAAVHELFEARAAAAPDRVAVEVGGVTLTYAELDRQANRLAHHLVGLGVGPEVRVGVFLDRSVSLAVGLLGILKAGGAYVPLDPSYPAERVALMLEDSRAAVVLTQESLLTSLPTCSGRLLLLDRAEGISREPSLSPGRRASADGLAYVIYTSGSTGRPKGVQVPHRGVVNFLSSMARRPGLGPADTLVSVTTLSFDIFGLELYLPLSVGARVVLADRETASDGPALRRLLERAGATAVQATPATWRLLLAAGWAGRPPLRVLCGGEALPRDLAERLLECAPEVWNLYGPTETTIWSAVHRVSPGGPASAPLGRPIANTRIYLLDAALQPAAPGVPGELCIGGDGLARGYLGRPDLTADRFVPDPLSGVPGSRLYRTGDLARHRADGDLEFLGRLDHQVKVRGFRVELGEVEAALASHPAVRQSVVVAREDASGGHRLVAYAVFAGQAPDVGELRRYLAGRLPDPFVPSLYVSLDRLPLTPNGKVDRKVLPVPEAARREAVSASPRSALERAVAGIWREVLQVETVGLDDNFFDLGGHSLLAAQVHARLHEQLGIELPMVDLFRHPTVRSLARCLSPGDAVAVQAEAPARSWSPGGLRPAVAIVGMAGRFPKAGNVGELWQRLRAGEECISFFTEGELREAGVEPELLADPAYVRAAGVLDGAEMFDAPFFGLNPREAELMDPQHRVFLECAWESLEDSGYDPERYRGRIGLYAGVGINTYLHHAGVERVQELAGRYQAFIANDKDFVPTRASYKLNLRGPSVNVQTACSTSLVALHLACQALLAGDCDMALAGGVAVRSPQKAGYLYEEGGILSPDGRCRAFDAAARGTVFGNGVGLVVLKPLDRALADGDEIRAVIRGTALNNDGSLKVGYTAPSVEGQARVVADALAAASVDPGTVTYVETHGTGTPMGDPIEVAALAEVFGPRAPRPGFCALGSVKTNLGHLDTAAGVAGLIKTVLALQHRELPPSLHFESPNPHMGLERSPFRIAAALEPWPMEDGAPRRAGVSSFGIGGTNAHAVLEEAPEPEPSGPSRSHQLLVLSARTPAALDAATRNLATALASRPDLELPDVAHTLRVGRRAFAYRRMLVCRDREEAVAALGSVDPERVLTGAAETPEAGGVAFLLSGQGSQHPGMGRGLYESEPTFRRELDACAELLRPHLGLDLRALLFPPAGIGDEAARELQRTALAQPALFTLEYALARLWMEWGVRPQALLGHSLGEYVAACLAGVFELSEALTLVAARGRLMQALPSGAMLGVQLSEAELVPLFGSGVSLAAVNGPAACVASGPEEAVEELRRRLEARSVRHRRLHTSHAFHSAMMDPILGAFGKEVARVRLRAPEIPFVSNLTGTWIRPEEATDPGYWVRHLRGAVRFADGVRALLAEPGRALLEVGPGNALSTLARPCLPLGDRRVVAASLPHPHEGQPDQVVILRALGRLWLAGAAPDWEGFAAHERRRRVPLPTYPFERQRYWLEPVRREPRAADRLARKPDLADWFYAPMWRQAPLVPGRENSSPWLLLGEPEGPSAALVESLAERLDSAVRVRAGRGFARLEDGSYEIDPAAGADWDALLSTLAEEGRFPVRVVHAWNLTGEPVRGPRELLANLDGARARAYDSVLYLAQALDRGRAGAAVRVAVVSDGLHRLTNERELHPEKALLLGPVLVAPQEAQGLELRSVDVDLRDDMEDLAEDLLVELAAPSEEPVVAWRGGSRWVRSFGPVRLERDAGPLPVRDGGVYLVTGGLGGLGLILAAELAGQARIKLALLGRTALPPRESWEAAVEAGGETARRIRDVLDLEARGAEVLTLAVDVTDEVSLAEALVRISDRLGPVDGVLHAAGVPGGGLMQLASGESAERVLAPKVRGTLLLQALLGDRPLDFFAVCSSINSVIGGFGQVDYCAANAFCDAFAQAGRRRRGPRVVSIGWDRWEEVGMAARSSLPPVHPLLDARVEPGPEREVYTTRMTVERHWVLSEHRIAGNPTVPGTTFLEMARAAFARRAPGHPVEIREAVFLSPLAVPKGESREVLTILEGAGTECGFRVVSRRGEEPWQEHARGRIAALEDGVAETRDVAALLAACSREASAPVKKGGFLVTGPRWASLRRLCLGPDGESVAELELDGRFAAELDDFVLHPALLDVAAGAVQLLGDGDYLPLAYERLAVRAPLPRRGYSHFRLRGPAGETLTCDIDVLSEAGEPCVEIEGFSMKRVGQEAEAQLQRASAPSASRQAGGILPAEGGRAFLRVLRDAPSAHVVVSTRDLPAVIENAASLTRARLEELAAPAEAHARPEVSSAYIPPADDLERGVAEVWERVLGIERVGVHDNFFELGGTSLTGIQVVAELKKRLGVEVPTVSIFEAPTVSALVRYLRPKPPAGSTFERSRSRAEKKKQVLAAARRAPVQRRR